MPDIVICGHHTCSSIVPPSKNPGRPRRYCSMRCQQAAAVARYRDRERSARSTNLYSVESDGREHVFRRPAHDAKAADKRFREHEKKCGRDDGGRCPGRNNPYSVPTMERCLVYATFRDDWDAIRRVEKGYQPKLRTASTTDGYWIEKHPLWPNYAAMLEEGLLGEGEDDRGWASRAEDSIAGVGDWK